MMKHINKTILLVILTCMVVVQVSAEDIAEKNSDGKTIYYNFNSDYSSVTVTYQGTSHSSYSDEYSGEIVIPETITYDGETYSVTSIGNYAFSGCSGLTSVTIPESVTSIGDRAFYGCSGLTSVTIPNSVTSISDYAFSGCSRLEKVIVPDIKNWCSIKFDGLDDNPLYYAHHLYSDENTEITELVIPDGVTSIGYGAFFGCSGLTSVTIGNGVTSIGSSAFSGCSGLTSVTIPTSVTSIESSAFSGCSSLTSVTIPNSVTSIGVRVFLGCSGLAEIKVANGNSVYDSRNNCNAIIKTSTNTLIVGCKNTIIPNSVTSIREDAFQDCSGLTSVTIPESVTSIGDRAFYYCI